MRTLWKKPKRIISSSVDADTLQAKSSVQSTYVLVWCRKETSGKSRGPTVEHEEKEDGYQLKSIQRR